MNIIEKQVKLNEIIDLSDFNVNNIVSASIDNDGINILSTDRRVNYRDEEGIFPALFSEPKNYRILRFDLKGNLLADIVFKNEILNFHFINYLIDQNFLLTCARSMVVPLYYIEKNEYLYEYVKPLQGYDKIYATYNAKIINNKGEEERKLLLGDGIEKIVIDNKQYIWVGYFDEGIFGNFGWGIAEDEIIPIGITGLVGFDLQGNKIWEFDDDLVKKHIDVFADIMPLNIDNHDNIWFNIGNEDTYLIKKNKNGLEILISPVDFAEEILIKDNYILFINPEFDEEEMSGGALFYLKENNFEHKSNVNFYLPDGKNIDNIYFSGMQDRSSLLIPATEEVSIYRGFIPSNGQVLGYVFDKKYYYITIDEVLE